MVNNEDTVQVVNFMLNNPSPKILKLVRLPPPLEIIALHINMPVSLNMSQGVGQAQTTFRHPRVATL